MCIRDRSGEIGKQISGYVDLALLLRSDIKTVVEDAKTVKKQVRVLVTQQSSQYRWIKDRSGQLPPEVEVNFEDDYQRLHNLIFDGVKSIPAGSSSHVEDDGASVVEEPQEFVSTGPTAAKTVEVPAAETIKLEGKLEDEPVVPEIKSENVEQTDAPVVLNCDAADCSEEVSEKQAKISKIRARQVLCREHFMEYLKK